MSLNFYNKGLLTDRGRSANVYRFDCNDGKDYVGKVIVSKVIRDDISFLEKEFAFGFDLFLRGISTPEPKGIYSVLVKDLFPVRRNAYISEYVRGIDFCDFYLGSSREFFDRGLKLLSEEIEKVKEIGYIPGDYGINAIYFTDYDKVYLFDFESWDYLGDDLELKKFN